MQNPGLGIAKPPRQEGRDQNSETLLGKSLGCDLRSLGMVSRVLQP